MKSSNIIFLGFLFSLLLLASCNKKCNFNELGSLSFSAKNLSLIPYSGHDTLTWNYFDERYDELKGNGRSNEYYKITTDSKSVTDDQSCNGDYYRIAYNKTSFNSQSSALTIALWLEYDNPFKAPEPQKYLGLSIGATYDPNGAFFNRFVLYNDSIAVNEPWVYFHDTLTIGPNLYTSVYELHGYYTWYNYIALAYYSKERGIIATKDHEGHFGFFNNLK